MRLSDFDFDLPEALIATRPVRPRTAARLLVAEGPAIADRHVRDLATILRPGDRLVFNDTRVIPARLSGTRSRQSRDGSGVAKIELTLMEPTSEPGSWRVMAKPLRKLAIGDRITFVAGLGAAVTARGAEDAMVLFDCSGAALDTALEAAGEMPLPPYIAAKRAPDAADREDYQTVFARVRGAVAAPTAALHFDDALVDALKAHGVAMSHVTLHVGAGTFLPVKTDDVADHVMHAEWGEVTDETAAAINRTRADGGRVIAVGTTSLRLLETAAASGDGVQAFRGETAIFIRPGHVFRAVDGLMTNFHLPKSTLLMLVSALMGTDEMRQLYAHAIARGYRFFSYGDSSLLIPPLSSRQGSV